MVLDVPRSDPRFGQAQPCPACHSYLASTRLSDAERAATLAALKTRTEPRLYHMAERMLSDPYGFLSLYGGTGTGKSDVMVALVAEFARAGREAQYWHGAEVAIHLDNKEHQEMWLSRLSALDVLCIEEIDDLHQRLPEWSRPLLSSLIDARYRHRAHQVTLLTMQSVPELWNCPVDISSRIRDGRFNRTLGSEDIPGLLCVAGDDKRLALRRRM